MKFIKHNFEMNNNILIDPVGIHLTNNEASYEFEHLDDGYKHLSNLTTMTT